MELDGHEPAAIMEARRIQTSKLKAYIAINNISQSCKILQGTVPILHKNFWSQFSPKSINSISIISLCLESKYLKH